LRQNNRLQFFPELRYIFCVYISVPEVFPLWHGIWYTDGTLAELGVIRTCVSPGCAQAASPRTSSYNSVGAGTEVKSGRSARTR